MTDTEYPSISEVQPTRHLTASADCILYPDQETLLCVRSAQIRDGDVMIVPSPRFMSKGVVIATCLVRFTEGSATPLATKATSEQIRLPESANVASVVNGEAVSLLPICSVLAVSRPSNSGQSLTPLAATITTDLTERETQLLLQLLEKHKDFFGCFSSKLGQTSVAAHRIETEGTQIVRRRPYRVSSSERKVKRKRWGHATAQHYSSVLQPVVFPRRHGEEEGWFSTFLCRLLGFI